LDLTSSLLWYTTLLNPTLSGIKKAVFLGTASLFNLVSLDLGYIVISPISALNKEAFLGNGSAMSAFKFPLSFPNLILLLIYSIDWSGSNSHL
jgi:hypothetical protein